MNSKKQARKMEEQLLKNSHDIYIGQRVKIVDKDVLDLYEELTSQRDGLYGTITDIDGEDIRIKCEASYYNEYCAGVVDLGGWNISFSVIC